MELLQANTDYSLSTRIINNNAAFFSSVEPEQMEKLFRDRLSWIDWLKSTKREDLLEKIRASANEIITNGVPAGLLEDDSQYSDFIAGLTAFDYTAADNHQALENVVSNTLIQRCNSGKRTMPEMVIRVIDQMDIPVNPSVLMALAQEAAANKSSWLWNKMEKDAAKSGALDMWFESLISPLEPAKLQRTMNIHILLGLINTCFSNCRNYIPALVLLTQAREYIEKHGSPYSGNEYNRIVDLHKKKIEKARKQLQKTMKPQSDEEQGKGE
jgi:hypothetical protein